MTPEDMKAIAFDLATKLITVTPKPDAGEGGPWWLGLELNEEGDAFFDQSCPTKAVADNAAEYCREALAGVLQGFADRQTADLRRQLAEAKEENERLRVMYENLHPRIFRLIQKGRQFIVIGVHEPYYKAAYDMIRAEERKAGTWTDADEEAYARAIIDWHNRKHKAAKGGANG